MVGFIGVERHFNNCRLNRGSNSQPPGHESDTLTTEPPGRGYNRKSRIFACLRIIACYSEF